jgi:hypothetical protein
LETSTVALPDGSLISYLSEKVALSLEAKYGVYADSLAVQNINVLTLTLRNINLFMRFSKDQTKPFLSQLATLIPFLVHFMKNLFEISKTLQFGFVAEEEQDWAKIRQRKEIGSCVEALFELFSYFVKYENNWVEEFKNAQVMELLWNYFLHFDGSSIISSCKCKN